jgi:serine/threonine protein kinase
MCWLVRHHFKLSFRRLHDFSTEALGAVKILLLHGDQQVRDLIHAEARISARLRHPHLIPMVDFGLEEGVPYLVMMDAVHGTLRTRYPRHAGPCSGGMVASGVVVVICFSLLQ